MTDSLVAAVDSRYLEMKKMVVERVEMSEANKAPAAPSALGRVLVVDDEPHIREVLSLALQDAGFDVVSAGDGFEAVRAVRETPPDLILLDLMMPAMDGRSFLDVYRNAPGPKVPIVVVTAARSPGRDVEHELGTAVVHKPFSIDHLLGVVRRHLEFA